MPDDSKSLAKAITEEDPKAQSFYEVLAFDLQKLTYENMSLQELCLVGVREQKKNIAGHHPEEDGYGERVILIQGINKLQLHALINSFGINALMLLDMEIS